MMMGIYIPILNVYFPDRLNDLLLVQFTGLHNNTDKEVFEGEIVTFYGCNYAIEFQDGCFGIMDGDDFITLSVLQLNGWWIDPIGNIYENPELIGGENEKGI